MRSSRPVVWSEKSSSLKKGAATIAIVAWTIASPSKRATLAWGSSEDELRRSTDLPLRPPERPFTVTIRAMNENGEQYEATGSELLGRCFQHEIDHLDGKLFIDYLSPLKRKAAMAKWEKSKTEYPGFIRKVKAEVPGEHHHETEM